MLLSPIPPARFSVPLLILVCATAAIFAAIHVSQPIVNASAGGRMIVAGRFDVEASFLPAGNTIVVNSTSDVLSGSDGLCTLREAIGAANANTASGGSVGECAAGSGSGSDTINFSVNGTIDLGSVLPNVSSDMTIDGPGSGVLTVRRDTGGDYRIFNITFGTVGISGLTVANGKTADGIAGNSGTNAQYGGGILNAGTLSLTDVNLTGNRTGAGGAGFNFGGAGGFGGALANIGNTATVTMTDCNVTGNITGNGGAGNAAVGDGGRGGGIYNENNLTMTNCSVNGNTTGDSGTTAGVGGRGGEGGGIYSRIGVLTLTTVTVNNNVTGSVPVGNGANNAFGGSGGGIFTILGTATLTNCTISGNQTGTISGGTRAYGGGINNECPMTIISTTISGNTGNAGSAILNRRALKLTNSTISGNNGPNTIISNDSSSSLTLTNSTITANNSVGVIGGGTFSGVRNSIIAGNGVSGSSDVEGSFTSQGNNLIGVNGSGLFGSSGFTHGVNNDQVGTSANPLNARLALLGNYGGPTQTHALLPGSPALDAGNNCVAEAAHCSDASIPQLTTDQRGFNRVVNSTVDIGAFESRGFTISATSGTPQSTVIGSDFAQRLVATVNSAFGEPVAGGVITFAAPVSGASVTFAGSVTTVTANANSSGVATSPAFLANGTAGSYNVVASLAGGSPSANFSLTNSKAPTTTSVFSSVNPSQFGQTVTFSAVVGTNGGFPTGTVQFKDGLTNLGSPVNCAMLPPNACFAEFSTSTLSVGNHSISAEYSGDANFLISSATLSGEQVVNCVSTVVSNTNDSGPGSLRQAILGACPGGIITFAAGLTSGGPATITLTSGELLIDKNLTISGPGANLLSVSGNDSSRVLNVQTGTVRISGLAIINGRVGLGVAGGGVANRSSLTLINCVIAGNSSELAGGGIWNSAETAPAMLTIINSTISGNKGNSFGSGIFNGGTNGATVNLINSTVTGNSDVSFGGGIYNSDSAGPATLNVTNSTIAGNRAESSGGGIFNSGNNGAGIVNLNNSIVADNTVANNDPANGFDIYNFFGNVSANNNVIESSGGGAITGSNNSNVDPLLEKDGIGTVVLKNNGGPTKTVLPAHNSSAINAGGNAALPVDTFDLDGDGNTAEPLPIDQRGPGFSRVVNTTVDIGAVEVNYTVTVFAGSPQSAVINTAFGTQLQARVQESGINLSGFAVTFTAPASGASGSFSGSATVNTNASGIATAPVFTANGTAGGPYNVLASLSGGSPSTNFVLTNLKIPTTTVVSSSVSPSEFGQSVTFTATVSSNAGAPAGSVQFKDGGANLGAAQTLNAGGVAQLTISSLTSGTHSISAEYLGNDTWAGSTGTLQDGQVVKPQPTLSINDVSLAEGNSGTANLTFTVTLSAASNLTVSAGYSTANGTATTADSDYQATSGTVTFTPGDLTETVTVLVKGDQKTELDETVFVVLSNPVNAAFSDSQGTGTILNDDTLQLLLDTSGPDATQLAALDALLLIRDPFRVQNTATWFTSEPNTGVILFALNLQLGSGESPSVVKITLVDGNGQPHEVAAEDVRTIANTTFTQVTFRLPDLAEGTCLVTIRAHERISNTGTFRIAP